MADLLRILHLEDNKIDAEFIQETLQQQGFLCTVKVVDNFSAYSDALTTQDLDLILSDFNLPSFDGMSALKLAQLQRPNVPFIFVSGTIGEERAIESLKSGATDYVLKGNLNRLASVISRALREKEERAKREAAELQVAHSEEKYRTIFEASGTALALIGEDFTIQLVNSVFTKLSGYSKEEIEGKRKWTEFIAEKDLESMKRYHDLRRKNSAAAPAMYEFRFIHRTGELRTVLLTIAMIPRSMTSVASMIDITESKRLDEKIREQAALLDVGSEAIMVLTMDDRVTFWNTGAEQLYGWKRDEILEKPVSPCFPDELWSRYEDTKRTVLRDLEWRGEWIRRRRDGAEVIIASRWTLVQDAEQRPKFIYVVDEDITELKTLERQFLRVQRLESIGTLAGGIAHDLNNILGPIMMATAILRRENVDPKTLKLLDTVEASAKRGADMIKQVLTFARGVEGERVLLQPRHIIREIVSIGKETFPKSIRISENLAMDLRTILGDATQVHQTLMNLFINARDAMPEGGELTITANNVELDERFARRNPMAKVGTYVLLSVRDTGTGIPPEVLDQVFDPFFTTKEYGKGTGLGLSTVLGIVKAHGGFIDVRSEVGKGTEFSVYFPISDTAPQQSPPARRANITIVGRNELIMVVDDEAAIREVTVTTLEDCGFRVLTASDGDEAVSLFQQRQTGISLILTDIMMPRMDGIAMIKEILKIKPDQRFVVISGLAESGRLNSLDDRQRVVFLQKPFTSDVLLETISEVLKCV